MRNFVAGNGVQHVDEIVFRDDNQGHLSIPCKKSESIRELNGMNRTAISYCGEQDKVKLKN